MLGVVIFAVILIAFVLFAVWLGRGPETKGKAGDSVGTTFTDGAGGAGGGVGD